MSVSRVQAIQGETVRLRTKFYHNNELADPYSLGTVQILNPSDVVLATASPTQESVGIYYVDYTVGAAATVGWYTDVWNSIVYEYGWDSQTVTNSFYVQQSSWDAVAPNTCRVYDYVYYANGTPRPTSIGYATITQLPYDYSNALFSNRTDDGVSATSDSAGYIYWEIIWGAQVVFEIEDAGIGKEIIIPELSSVRLTDATEV